MKKVNSMNQLRAEKKRLKQRRGELEKAIRYDWQDVKETLKPRNLVGQLIPGIFNEKDAEKKNNTDMLTEAVKNLTGKMIGKAGDTIGKWMKKKIS